MMMKLTPDSCRSCGACCTSESTEVVVYGFADLLAKDVARLSPHVRSKLQEIQVGGETRHATHAKQLPEGEYACQFLRGTPGQRCSCTIYETRPRICRDFRVGGNYCRRARAAAGMDRSK